MTSSSTTAEGLCLVSAGAGSGKTYRLTQVVTEAVDPRATVRVALEGLVAVTYTRKAAAELEARIRQMLITEGAAESTRELPLAQLGTVHAVCLRWLREFALDVGLSPLTEVLPGDESRALRQALEWGLSDELRTRLNTLAEQLDVRWDARAKRWDWLEPVQEIMTLARSNRIPPAALQGMAERASERLRALMGAPESDPAALDAELSRALTEALSALDALPGGPKKLQDARRDLQSARRRLTSGRLPWSAWIALQKTDAGKAARDALVPLAEVARRVDRHPRLQAQLHGFIHAAYEAAAVGLTAYDRWKRERRVVDFVDMVDLGLTLLDAGDVRAELAQRLALCAVDEFQDTSPAQLALFVRLHELCHRSVWVGDPKQCIFEYAGADPELMQAVTDWAGREGGSSDTLNENRRSRPELVQACSRLFVAAFSNDGYRPEQVAMSPVREARPELDALPPFGVWWLEGSNRELAADALAEGVARLLRNRAATLVIDRGSETARPVEPRDIAVLVATNAEAEQVTSALGRRGLRSAVARAGLLDTPEGTLVQAGLSYAADRSDERSLAVVEALTGFGGDSPEAWLEAKIARYGRLLEARQRGDAVEPSERAGVAAGLERVRDELPILGPAEALDRVLATLDMAALCARWPGPEQRLANLEALRALAARYEARCRHQREAASVAGLLRFFDEAKKKVLVQDEERASDDQHTSQGPDTITVSTYHRAKGLEWPVVVLGSLDRSERRDAFSVQPQSDRETFDPADPLGGRWIRYWPWPYGQQRNAPLANAVASAPEGQHVQRKEARERVRLLYVGFTRARDHLVLAVRRGRQAPNAAWLDELSSAGGAPLISLPDASPDATRGDIRIGGIDGMLETYAARTWVLQASADTAREQRAPEPSRWFARPPETGMLPSRYAISPSRAERDWPELEVGEPGRLMIIGSRLPLRSESPKDWSRVGDTLHAFLAADVHGIPEPRRLARAERLLRASGLLSLIEANDLVSASDSLRRWVDASWPRATWHRELPISGVVATPRGERRIDGVIDLLLEMPQGVVIIDHKSYPGRRDTCREKAHEHAPQLAAYAHVLRMAGKHVLSQWISFSVSGAVVQINQQRGRALQVAAAGAREHGG